jgi:hypothetical protein
MSGPRVTSGEESKQDYATPDDFMAAVVKRFGPISFDLAAHARNKKHARYFAPTKFVEVLKLGFSADGEAETWRQEEIAKIAHLGGTVVFQEINKKGQYVYEKTVPNTDPEAYALDAFAHSWSALSKKFGDEHPSGYALLWNNCEFNDAERWSARHRVEMAEGTNSLLLTPIATTNWYRNNIAGISDVYELSGRLCFDGKHPFLKDCMLSHYHPRASGKKFLWDWREGVVAVEWERKT